MALGSRVVQIEWYKTRRFLLGDMSTSRERPMHDYVLSRHVTTFSALRWPLAPTVREREDWR